MTKSIVDSVLAARYLREGETSFEDVCRRVANAISDGDENKIKTYYDAMINLEFLPNSPTLMNAGTPMGQLSACFTLPVEDSLKDIFDAIQWGALIHQSGGGTGYNFSKIRPEGSPVHSTDGVASGPVSFMRVFNSATDVIKQGGRRRGANMGILDARHPDILKFLKSKEVEGDLSNFNISVMVDDAFMTHVDEGTCTPFEEEVWNTIVDGVWRNGEPGILFYDTINEHNPTPWLGNIEITNPCGEQPLLPFESCVLGSINLSKLVEDGEFDWTRYRELIVMGVEFLNDVLDHNSFPIPQIAEATLRTRKIGLGVMGLHDALIKLGIPYSSEEARAFARDIASILNATSYHESALLVIERGMTYPAYNQKDEQELPTLNAARTTIAPTGSISILADCSSGIEPHFSYVYERRNTVGESFKVVNPLFKEALHELNLGKEPEEFVISEMFSRGSIQHLDFLPLPFREMFETALDIDGKTHIDMQACFQSYIDASISKTINVPESTTKAEIENLIIHAWHSDCKGLTIYRNNSRKDVVLALDKKEEKDTTSHKCDGECKCHEKFERPKYLTGMTHKVKSGCCDLYVTVNYNESGNPMEVFIQTAGTGCNASNVALGRMISVALQNGISVQDVVKQLSKVNCISAIKNKNSEGKSCADVVGKCLLKMVQDVPVKDTPYVSMWEHLCPDCGMPLDFGEGCNQGMCKHCGWSGCS